MIQLLLSITLGLVSWAAFGDEYEDALDAGVEEGIYECLPEGESEICIPTDETLEAMNPGLILTPITLNGQPLRLPGTVTITYGGYEDPDEPSEPAVRSYPYPTGPYGRYRVYSFRDNRYYTYYGYPTTWPTGRSPVNPVVLVPLTGGR